LPAWKRSVYTVEKLITAETNQGVLASLFGDRLLFVAHGYVIAGIDMKQNPIKRSMAG